MKSSDLEVLWTLIKLQLNINFGVSALKYRFRKEKKRLWEPILIGFSILVGIGSISFLFTLLMIGIFIGGKMMNHPEMVLTIGFVGGPFVVLVFGIFYIMSAFYFSKDMDILIPLPIKPYHVMGSKFAVVMVNEYLTLIPVILPAIFVYGIGTGQNPVYWLKAGVLFILAPVLPLTAGALVVVFLMRFINVRKSKDLLAVIGGFLSLILGLGINLFAQRIPKGNEGEFFKNILGQMNLTEVIGGKFPPSVWATYGLSMDGIAGNLYFLLFVGVSLAAFVTLLFIGNKLFYTSILSGQEVTRKRKNLTQIEMDKKIRRKSGTVTALFIREWKLLLRTPVYALNGLTGVIIGPFMVVMMFAAQGSQNDELLTLIENPDHIVQVSLVGLAFMLFTAGMNIVASTSVSREGKSFWISKMIPVSPAHQVMSKLLHSLSVSILGLIVTAVVLVVFIHFSIWRIVILLFVGTLGSTLIVGLNLLIDVLRPKLEWTNPQEAVKQNINGFFGILVSLLVMGVLAGAAVLMISIELPEIIIYFLLALLILILLIPSLWGLFRLADWKYERIEA